MQSLPIEIIINIVNYIPKITDKRQFTQTRSRYNKATKEIIKTQELTIKITHFKYPTKYCAKKFTLELCNDSYFNFIPDDYLIPENKSIVKALLIYNQIEILERAINNGCRIYTSFNYIWFIDYNDEELTKLDKNSCYHAIMSGNVEVLEYVMLYDCEWNAETLGFAVQCNNLDIIKCLKSYGGEMDAYSCSYASKNGNIEILDWLLKNGACLDDRSCEMAAIHGHIDTLKWLRQNNFYWDEHVCTSLAEGGFLEGLIWAIENGCNLNISELYYQSAFNNQSHIIKYMQGAGYMWDNSISVGAAEGGHLDLLKYLIEQGCGWDINICSIALLNKHINVCKWAMESGCIWNKEQLIANAIEYEDNEVIYWLNSDNCPK